MVGGEISFQQVVFFVLFLLVFINIRLYWKNGRISALGVALAAYWCIIMVFFWKAVFFDLCLVPGDIIFNYFPWRAWSSINVPHNGLLWDSVSNYFPWVCSLKSAMENGSFPLWNFHSYSGSPLAANLASAQFNPLNVFLFFMNALDFSTLLPFLRLFITSAGTFLFLRDVKFSVGSSFLGGLLFTFCGVNIVWLSSCPNISVLMYLPWILICMRKLALSSSRLWMVLFLLFSVFQFLGGHPETSFHVYCVALGYFFYLLFGEWKQGTKNIVLLKRLGGVAFTGLLALGCVAFQLFPFMEYLPRTTRYFEIIKQGNDLEGFFSSFEILKLVAGTLISPDFFGNPVDKNYWAFANYNEQNCYLTVAGLFLALVGAAKVWGKKSDIRFFLWVGIISFCIIVRVPFFYDFMKSLPGFSMAANYRLIFAMVFAMVVLAVAGIDELVEQKSVKASHFVCVFFILVIALCVTHYFTVSEIDAAFLGYRHEKISIFLVFLFVIFLLSMGALFSKKMAGFFPFILMFIVILDVWHYGEGYNTFMKRKDIFPETPLINFITSKNETDQGRVVGWRGALMAGAEQVYGYDSITGYDPMKIYDYEMILTQINGSYSPVFTPDIQSLDSEWLDFLNVKYIVTSPDNKEDLLLSEKFDLVYEQADGSVYRNKSCFPRAFWAEQIVFVNNHQQALDKISKNEFIPGRSVLIESEPSAGIKIYESAIQNPVEIVKHKANEIILKVNNSSGILVLSEVWFPGWKAFVDDTPCDLLRVNAAFMGISVPEFAKEVRLVYAPESFGYGVWTAVVSLLLFVVFIFFQPPHQELPSPPPNQQDKPGGLPLK